jgi:AbrB family looped-hinge helix DNA binding protein
MRTTIDGAGRVVIPKPLRDQAGLAAGAALEIGFRDGRIEIEPTSVPMRLRGHVIEAEAEMPPLTAEEVRDVIERTRR